MRGRFNAQLPSGEIEWCNRRILARIHRLTLGQLRREIEPVTAAQFQRFLCRWQHIVLGSRLHGVDGTLQIIKQLQGYEISAAAWEPEVLARRIAHYEPDLLDQLCLSGEVMWARLSPHPAFEDPEPRRVRPTRTAPIAIFLRESAEWLADREVITPVLSHPAREVLAQLEQRGASFFTDLPRATGRLSSEVEDGLWELVAAGLVTADGFENLRSLVDPKRRRGEGRGRNARPRHAAGRWALVRHTSNAVTNEARAAAFADQLLLRWGVIFRDLLARETLAPPWRDLLPVLRRKEAQGEIRGGRFVSGFTGEQFARPEALDLLRAIRRAESSTDKQAADDLPEIPNSDPLNLAGIILPGPRVSTLLRGNLQYATALVTEPRA
jgi:ATP-dependent Lhr-like helicase